MSLVGEIERLARGKRNLRFMEVCGTHTVAIFRAGIRNVLPANVELISGPGCPVCVTGDEYIDRAVAYAKMDCVTVATFGDMLKVPGSSETLAEAAAAGADVRVVYSPLECLELAAANPSRRVVFLAVGFETTAPTAAATILAARDLGLTNLLFLSAQKLVPPALKMLLADSAVRVDGFLLPGHVAVVIGTRAFEFLKVPAVVAGFEPEEILLALVNLLRQVDEGRAVVANEYRSVVRVEGNLSAQGILARVYEVIDAEWRGLGTIPKSGLRVREEFAAFDAERVLPVSIKKAVRNTACRCGEVLRGAILPTECPLFGKACRPERAVGPCMISVEGVCAAWYKYGGLRLE